MGTRHQRGQHSHPAISQLLRYQVDSGRKKSSSGHSGGKGKKGKAIAPRKRRARAELRRVSGRVSAFPEHFFDVNVTESQRSSNAIIPARATPTGYARSRSPKPA